MLQPQYNMFPQQQSNQSQQDQQQIQNHTEQHNHIPPPPLYTGHNNINNNNNNNNNISNSNSDISSNINSNINSNNNEIPAASSQNFEHNLYLSNNQQQQQQQRYQFLQQQQQQQLTSGPFSQQQYVNPIFSSMSSWNSQTNSLISQPSEPALQRLGINRRYSNHIQRLPSMSSINNSSPVSPNGVTTFMTNDNDNTNIDTNSSLSVPNNYSSLNQSGEPLPEKSIFKNYWGFNNSDLSQNSNVSNSNNNNIYQQNLPPSYNQRMHSISEIPQYSSNSKYLNNNINNPNRGRQSQLRPENSKLSTISSTESFSNSSSPNLEMFNSNSRSKSFATSSTLTSSSRSRSRYSVYLPTTHEDAYNQQNPQYNYEGTSKDDNQFRDLENQQLQQDEKISTFSLGKNGNLDDQLQYNNQQLFLQQQQQQQQQQQRYQRFSQYEISRFNNINNNNKILESQQQQIIPPLRAEGPVLADNNNNNTEHYQPPRRESVAAVYHQQNNKINTNDNHSSRNSHQLNGDNSLFNSNIPSINEISNTSTEDININQRNFNNSINDVNNFNNSFNKNIEMFENNVNSIGIQENCDNKNLIKIPKLTKINSINDLNPIINSKPKFRRASATNTFISPMLALTTKLNLSYSMCVPEYDYQKSKNPRRILTKNNKALNNGGCDNENFDYILYVNDILGIEENKKYLVLDILGQGTFGQVVKCQNLKTQEIVAVKVVKARQECLQQSIAEGNVVEYLNKKVNPKYQKYFINLKDKFMHKYHLCLVFELLSSNLYELIKQNHHHGLCIKLIRNFSAQILDALCALKDIKIIHCDLKPENILLAKLNKPDLKVIDFGSACEEHQTLYSYVQSRFYRSPEVILGIGYSTNVDMWSFGCIVAELFLGLPLLPGASEYEQLVRMVEIFGMPPSWMMVDKKASNYIIKSENHNNNYNNKTGTRYNYRLKTLEEFNKDFGLNEEPAKQYFCDKNLNDIIMKYRLPKKNMNKEMIDKEMHERSCLVHFLKGVLNISPLERWTPHEAIQHPFITGESWTGKWIPSTLGFGKFEKSDYHAASLV